jgi:hypothetical protein
VDDNGHERHTAYTSFKQIKVRRTSSTISTEASNLCHSTQLKWTCCCSTNANKYSPAVLVSPTTSNHSSPVLFQPTIPSSLGLDTLGRATNGENQGALASTSRCLDTTQDINARATAEFAVASLPEVLSHFLPVRTEGNSVETRDSGSPVELSSALTEAIHSHSVQQMAAESTSGPQPSPSLSEHALNQAQASSRSSSRNLSSKQASISSPAKAPQSMEQQASWQELSNQGPSPPLRSSAPGTTSAGFPQPSTSNSISTEQYQIHRPRGRLPNSPLPGASPPNSPNKRTRIQVPTMPSLKPRVELINAHIASAGGTPNLNNGLERPRFQLLIEACNNEDVFYVALHQLFCVWDYNRAEVANLPFLPSGPNLLLAFRILGQLIRDNEGLAPNHLKWFTQFPSPLENLLRTSEPYLRMMNDVGNFLGRLTSDWATFSKQCTARGYPPLVDELVNRMGLLSPILQQVVFTATRRNLGIGDDKYGQQMESYFSQDRTGHQELAARFNTARPPTEKEVRVRNQLLVNKYLQLYHQQQSHEHQIPYLHTESPPLQPPVLPSNDTNNQRTLHHNNNVVNPRQPYSGRSNPYGPSSMGVMPDHQEVQFPNHQMQPVPTATAALLNTGRPAVIIGQSAYENSPSPTFMQNRSMESAYMQSPNQQPSQWSALPPINTNVHGPPGQQPSAFTASSQTAINQNSIVIQNGQPNMNHLALRAGQQAFAIQQQQRAIQPQHQHQQVANPQGFQAQSQQYILPSPLLRQQSQQPQQMPQQRVAMHQLLPLQNSALHQTAVQNRPYLSQQQALQQQQGPQEELNNRLRPQQQLFTSANSRPSSSHRPNSNNSNRPSAALIGHNILSQQQAYAQLVESQSINRPLVPPTGYTYPAEQVNPDLTALHQAHLRSPRLVPENFDRSNNTKADVERRFYQTVKEFAGKTVPTKVPLTSTVKKYQFPVTEQQYSLIPKDKWSATDLRVYREYKEGSLQFRLRFVKTRREVKTLSASDWVVSETKWPTTVYLEFNGTHLEVRRGKLNTKDQPIDLTSFILPPELNNDESVNVLRLSVPASQYKDDTDYWYFFAIEVIEIMSHKQITEHAYGNRVQADVTLHKIRDALTSPADNDDIAMEISDLTIDLADPFTTKIFTVPVRGLACLHRECYDLETYLITRDAKGSKPKQPGAPTMADVWKCPLCGLDARPQYLLVDCFLVNARETLRLRNALDVKAILVSADGSWRPKPEPQPTKRKTVNSYSDDGETSEEEMILQKAIAKSGQAFGSGSGFGQNNGGSRPQSRAQASVDIIDLDD